MNFVAIDFETASYKRNSACAVGLVRVEDLVVTDQAHFLIRPPEKKFVFTWLHGISWEDVKDEPDFPGVWRNAEALLEDIEFLVAHNAGFDQSVLLNCCIHYGIEPPGLPFRCTMALARHHWKIYPTKLPDVCSRLNISLTHHEALSDSLACAQIMIEALKKKQPD